MHSTKRGQILDLLQKFVAQRPGMEPGNYGDAASYRAESRQITQDRHDFNVLCRQVELMELSIPENVLREAFRGGRLSITDGPGDMIALDYCTGQYFPTEYRRAACRVLASALWTAKRESLQTSIVPTGAYADSHIGDRMRAEFRRQFGRRIASRYFD